jgi:hypothetical protein
MISSPGCVSRAGAILWRLNNSLVKRFARFRLTADPSFRLAATPNRDRERVFETRKTVMNRA